jgi:hypothetical protein
MINKMKRIILMGAMILGVSFFTSNCALFDPAQNGPSCEYSVYFYCMDLIDTEATAIADFTDDCELGGGTFSDTGCDLTEYDVSGHCEMDFSGNNIAIWFSSSYYTAALAESVCSYTGEWVDGTIL